MSREDTLTFWLNCTQNLYFGYRFLSSRTRQHNFKFQIQLFSKKLQEEKVTAVPVSSRPWSSNHIVSNHLTDRQYIVQQQDTRHNPAHLQYFILFIFFNGTKFWSEKWTVQTLMTNEYCWHPFLPTASPWWPHTHRIYNFPIPACSPPGDLDTLVKHKQLDHQIIFST